MRVIEAAYKMNVNGLGCEFNSPPAVKSRKDKDGNEVAQSLPPHKRVPAFAVDEYPACPDNWMHGSAKASSYFLAIKEGEGMWLDFNQCARDNHDIAAVVSVQGINSVTGQKTDVMRLEQYKTKCPVHDKEFKQDRFCEECKYSWPAQNYIATTGTPAGNFWLDGFRAKDGVVRQYIFTADEAKGVAAKKIGNDRVFAIGIAFYRSKNPKPVRESRLQRDLSNTFSLTKTATKGGPCGQSVGGPMLNSAESDVYYSAPVAMSDSLNFDSDDGAMSGGPVFSCCVPSAPGGEAPVNYSADNIKVVHKEREMKTSSGALRGLTNMRSKQHTNSVKKEITMSLASAEMPKVSPKTYEVGAGARINQEVHPDPKDLDYWEEEPAGMLYINYTDAETVTTILQAGRREEKEEGMLSDVAVGSE